MVSVCVSHWFNSVVMKEVSVEVITPSNPDLAKYTFKKYIDPGNR